MSGTSTTLAVATIIISPFRAVPREVGGIGTGGTTLLSSSGAASFVGISTSVGVAFQTFVVVANVIACVSIFVVAINVVV
jgi:hypothetical protein